MWQKLFCFWKCAILSGPALLTCLMLAGCQIAPSRLPVAQTLDATPRLAILSAFEPELKQFLSQAEIEQVYQINGRSFHTGTLAGHDVVLFLSGVSMINAAMNTQAALDHFQIDAIVFSGIAGGINPNLRIGDVVIPKQWAQYQEQLFARQSGDGWDTGWHSRTLGSYGMMFPQKVAVTRNGGRVDAEEEKFWFLVDPAMLRAAETAAGTVELERCATAGRCLANTPRVVAGGNGVSGSTFVDNADYRDWVWQNFQADAVDMETAAVAHVAYVNKVPFIAFRSLSDLAGGGPGANEMATFLQLAADHASTALLAFLEVWER